MKLLLALLCVLELLFATFLVNTLGPYISPIVFAGSGIGIAWLYLRIASSPATAEVTVLPSKVKVVTIMQWVLFLALSYLVISSLKHYWWYHLTYGDTKSDSDIIPQIKTLVQRWMNGSQPYYTIQFMGYDLFPTYLPLQWIPYMLCEWAQKDYRWIPTFSLWMASLWFFLRTSRQYRKLSWELLIPIWPLVIWWVYLQHDWKVFVFAVEGLIVAYYLLVAEALHKKNTLVLAFGISACLLSRYSIVFWVPMCMLLLYKSGNKRKAVLIGEIAIVFAILIYWLPFLRIDPSIFIQGYRYHTNAALGEWTRDMQVFNGSVYLRNGLGFTSYALAWIPGTLAHKLAIYKNIHLLACIVVVIGMGWYYIKHHTSYDVYVFLLFSFKVYLVVFYVFIQIPYKYLLFLPVMISVSLLGSAVKGSGVNKKQTLS